MSTVTGVDEKSKPFFNIAHSALYVLLIFTPLAMASVQDWAVTCIEIITLIALSAFLLGKSIDWQWQWIKTPLDKPIIALLILSFLSAVFSRHRHTSFWAMILLINYIILFYLVIYTVRNRAQFRRILWLIVSIAAFLSIFGLLKKYVGNPFPWWRYDIVHEKAGHLISTYGNRSHLAGYLEMTLPIVIGLMITGYRNLRLFVLILFSGLLSLTLLLTMSRGGWISACTGILLMAFLLLSSRQFNKKKLVLSIITGAFVLMFIAMSSTTVIKRLNTLKQAQETVSLQGRQEVWNATLKLIVDYPFFGVGPGNYTNSIPRYLPPSKSRFYYAHNDYFQFAAVVGLPVLAIIVWMMFCTYKTGFKKLKNESRLVRGSTLGALSGITAILIHSMIDFNLQIPANAILFTVLVALVVCPSPINSHQHNKDRSIPTKR